MEYRKRLHLDGGLDHKSIYQQDLQEEVGVVLIVLAIDFCQQLASCDRMRGRLLHNQPTKT